MTKADGPDSSVDAHRTGGTAQTQGVVGEEYPPSKGPRRDEACFWVDPISQPFGFEDICPGQFSWFARHEAAANCTDAATSQHDAAAAYLLDGRISAASFRSDDQAKQ